MLSPKTLLDCTVAKLIIISPHFLFYSQISSFSLSSLKSPTMPGGGSVVVVLGGGQREELMDVRVGGGE